jgi:acyl-CoA synthetase (NDP forming)
LRKNEFPGRIYPVNPSYTEIDGLRCYPTVAAIGEPVDLALMAIPANLVLPALEACAAAHVRHAVVISSGFAEEGGDSVGLQQQIAHLARRTGMRVSGPNAEGFYNEPGRVSATFSPTVEVKSGQTRIIATERRIGIVAQSGGVGFSLFNRGKAIGLSFSSIVTTGNEADLAAGEFLEYLVEDPSTDVVMLFLEGVRDPENFVRAAERAARIGKPVIVCKVGRSEAGARAAASHTASMTGWNAGYDAIFARYGFLQADDPDEAVAMAALLATAPLPKGKRVGVVTPSGGAGAWVADTIGLNGLDVPVLSEPLQARIRALIPSYGSARNPVDITAQGVHTGALQKTIEMLNESDEVDLVLVVTSMASDTRVVLDPAVLKPVVQSRRKPIVFYTYTLPSQLGRSTLAQAGVVVHAGLAPLGKALGEVTRRGAFRAPETSAAVPPADPRLLARLRSAGGALSEHDTKTLLREAGVSLPDERLVGDPAQLEAAMQAVGFPLALKIQSPDITHKTEAGGVRLGISDATQAHEAYEAMLASVRRYKPEARIQGVLLQPMAPKGVEIILGAIRDPVFGPMVMVGFGGVMTELFKDVAYRPAPVSDSEARAMLDGLRAAPLLNGFRGAPRADVAALASLVAQISRVAASLGEHMAELELNPVIVHPEGQGVTVVDALLVPSPG